jgi:hypothetical protein
MKQDVIWYELKDLHSDHLIQVSMLVIAASHCALSQKEYARQMDLQRSTYVVHDISKDVI